MKKLRDRVRELTSARQSGKDVKQVIAELTPVIRGWGNYFRTGTADREFHKMDYYVLQRLRRWQYRRGGQRARSAQLFPAISFMGWDCTS
jgi:RNA-directed DNA polymerase